MFGKLVCFAAFLALASCQDCIPDQKGFYWTSPCSGQKFTNVFTPTNVVITQNNQSLDSQGGIDATVDLVAVITITAYDKTITNPLIDIGLQDYSKSLGKCKWNEVPTFGVLNNLNACDIVDNCHFDNPPAPTQFTVTVNIAALAGSFIGILEVNTYYGISLTFKDDKTDLACAYVQDKIIKI